MNSRLDKSLCLALADLGVVEGDRVVAMMYNSRAFPAGNGRGPQAGCYLCAHQYRELKGAPLSIRSATLNCGPFVGDELRAAFDTITDGPDIETYPIEGAERRYQAPAP